MSRTGYTKVDLEALKESDKRRSIELAREYRKDLFTHYSH